MRPGLYGLAVQVPAQVLGQGFDRDVAVFRRLGQGLAQDVVEVAGQFARQPARMRFVVFARQPVGGHRGPDRIGGQDRFLPGGVGAARRVVGLAADQQFVKHHAQRVNVGHGGDDAVAQLFGRGVVQGEGARAGAGDLRAAVLRFVEQLGDAEVEQADLAGRRHHDVGRLEVAVHHQVGVGVADRGADLQEQAQPLLHRQRQLLGVLGDRLALHIVQRQVGLAVAADAGIEQAGDVGVAKPRQDLAFAGETLAQAGVAQARAQQFHRHAALVQAVGARGQPDLAHAAFAERALEFVGTYLLAGLGREQRRVHDRFGQEVGPVFFQRDQLAQFFGQRRIDGLDLGEAARACGRFELDQFVEQHRQRGPVFGVHREGVLVSLEAPPAGTCGPSASRGARCVRSA